MKGDADAGSFISNVWIWPNRHQKGRLGTARLVRRRWDSIRMVGGEKAGEIRKLDGDNGSLSVSSYRLIRSVECMLYQAPDVLTHLCVKTDTDSSWISIAG